MKLITFIKKLNTNKEVLFYTWKKLKDLKIVRMLSFCCAIIENGVIGTLTISAY